MLQEPAASCDGNSHCSEVVDHVSSYQQQQAQFLGIAIHGLKVETLI
jgi:hypothetical protein